MQITFFGTGLMGTGFVRRMLANGHAVNVWNRSPRKARALVAQGAVAFHDPAAALAGAERIHLSLADDASVDALLEPLAGVMVIAGLFVPAAQAEVAAMVMVPPTPPIRPSV